MVKVGVTAERLAEATEIKDFLGLLSGNIATVFSVLPRFIQNEAGEYIVKVVYDGEGDITGFEDIEAAQAEMAKMGTKRLYKIAEQLREALKTSIVSPPSGGD